MGTSKLMVVFADTKRSTSSPFTLSSVKKSTLSPAVVTGVVFLDPLMGGRSNMSWVSMIYYYPITCLGDRGPNSQDHLLRSGSRLISANTHCADDGDKFQFAVKSAGTFS